jgi:predicted nucleotidyltransferase
MAKNLIRNTYIVLRGVCGVEEPLSSRVASIEKLCKKVISQNTRGILCVGSSCHPIRHYMNSTFVDASTTSQDVEITIAFNSSYSKE